MRHTFLVTVLAVGVATPSYADLTLKQTVTGKGLGVSGQTNGTTDDGDRSGLDRQECARARRTTSVSTRPPLRKGEFSATRAPRRDRRGLRAL